ncbi:MAG: hypothetical protein AB7G28_24130 [Pirellulales bacterium]
MSETTTAAFGKTLLPIGALIVLVGGAFLAVRYYNSPPTQPGTDEGRAVAEGFLSKVRSGKPGEAWDSATAEFKSIEGRESFIRKVKATPILKDELHFNSSQKVVVKEEPRSEYLFQSPDAKMIRVLIGFEGGNWKVDRLTM